MSTRRRWALGAALLLLLSTPVDAHAAAIKPGSACASQGARVLRGHTHYRCERRGKRLQWWSVTAPRVAPSRLSGSITVFAAASLTEAFTALAAAFHTVNPRTHVAFSFAGSPALAQQIDNGAPADVFASASNANMQQVIDAGAARTAVPFARNRMIVVTPPGNPAHVRGVADLADPAVKVAICQAQVPCGVTAAAVFAAAGVQVTPVTYEPDVKSVLTKVELGEVDAGIVYVSDARAARSRVEALPIPKDRNALTTYPIARLRASAQPQVAQAFIDFVLSDKGAAALAAAGFTVL